MAPRYQYIPQSVLDDEELARQSREWSEEQQRRIAEDWARSNAPDPLAPLRQPNQRLAQIDQQFAPQAPEPQAPAPSVSPLASPDAVSRTTSGTQGMRDISQFGHQTVSQADAASICGPVAAVRLASVYGNDIPVEAAVQAAREVGWTREGGMNGIANQKRLFDNLGIQTTIDTAPTPDKIIADAITGNPVTLSTPKHYFTVSNYDPQSGKLYVGKSGSDLKGGSEWMTLDEIRKFGGGINGALFANNPNTGLDSPTLKMAQAAPEDNSLQGLARRAAQQFGIDPDIFTRQIQQESGFQADARSPAGARGIAQFMPDTAKGVANQMGVSLNEFWKDPGLQLQGAAKHMSDLLQQFGGDMSLALAAYNAGPGNVQKYGGVPPFEETQRYVKNILAASPGAAIVGSAAQTLGRVPGMVGQAQEALTTTPVGRGLAAFESDVRRTQRETGLMQALAPGFGGADVSSALATGAQAAGIPGRAQTGQYAEVGPAQIPLGPAELIGFAAGMAIPVGPAGKASTVARTAGEEVAQGITSQFRRFFHGTSGAFARPEGSKFDPLGLYGPGYYLTSDARVAGGEVAESGKRFGVVLNEAMRADYPTREMAEAEVAAVKERARAAGVMFPDVSVQEFDQGADVLASGYAQIRGAVRGKEGQSGPNVRAVDVPKNLRLLDTHALVPPELLNAAAQDGVLVTPGDPSMWKGAVFYSSVSKALARQSPNSMTRLNGDPVLMNKWLASKGYDGIKYQGGRRVPMRDAAGKDIEHEVLVIFEPSLDKLRNAISGGAGGRVSAELASHAASATAGGAAGFATAPEDASPQERAARTLGGALLGGLGGVGATRMLGRGGGGRVPPGGPPAPPTGGAPGMPRLPGATAGTPQPSINDGFAMLKRNRALLNPSPLQKARDKWTTIGKDFERQVLDRYVDLNRLGRNVEIAVSTFQGRVPGAQWKTRREFQPVYDIIGRGTASNGESMLDNLNLFVKYQRDAEVALANSPLITQQGVAATTGKGVLRGTPVTAVGPSGLRTSSAGVTGANDAERLLNELRSTLTQDEWDRIVTADKIRQKVLDNALDERVASGLISNEAREWLLANYPHYNPTVMMKNVDEHILEHGGTSNMNVFTNNIRRLANEGIKPENDTEAALLSAIHYRMRSDLDVRRNDTVRTIIDQLRSTGTLQKVRMANATTRHDPRRQITWFENGNHMIGDLPADQTEIARSVANMDNLSLGIYSRLFQSLNTPLRMGAVVLSPGFWVMNAASDWITTFLREGLGTAKNVPRMLVEAAREGPLMQAYMEAGGGMAGITRAGTHVDVEKLIQESGGLFVDNLGKWERFKRGLLSPYTTAERIGQIIEMAPRLATFESRLKKLQPGVGKPSKALAPPGTSPYQTSSMKEAAMAGRRVTIDFARAGQAIKIANPLILFLNARVQGSAQPFRTLRDNKASRLRLAGLMAPFIAAEAWNRSAFPAEYKDIPEWERRSHAIVILGNGEPDPARPGSFKNIPRISIPLREWSTFLAPFRFTMDEYFDQNSPDDILSMAGRGLGEAEKTLQAASPVSGESAVSGMGGMVSAPARTFAELQLNEKFFSGSPIEPESMRNLPPSEKYTERTTRPAFAAAELSRKLGSTLSPTQWDFIFQENLAGLGRFLTGDRLNPLQSIMRTSGGQAQTNMYKKLDRELEAGREAVANITRASPKYATATKDEQQRMLRTDQLAYEEQLKERYGIDPKQKDYGLPNKYRGVTDQKQEQKIDEAVSKYQAWLSDRNKRPSERTGVPRPTPEETRLAARYSPDRMLNPARTKELRVRRVAQEARAREIERSLAR